MNIVSNNLMLKYFKRINIFKVDLGTNLKGPAGAKNIEGTIKIRDEFVKKYQAMTGGRIIRKYGEIGRLKFFEDGGVGPREWHIYDGEKIYEIEATNDDMLKEPGVYLTEVLQMLEHGIVDEEEVVTENITEHRMKDVTYSNMPEEGVRPNMKLPREQYIESLLNRRRLLEKTS